MDKKKIKINSDNIATRGIATIAIVLVTIIVIALFLMFFGKSSVYFEQEYVAELSRDWNITIHGETKSTDLPLRIALDPGEEVVIYKELPSNILDNTNLVTRNYHMKLNATVDGDVIYRYPSSEGGFLTNILVDDWNFIDIDPGLSGKVIELKFTAFTDGFSGLIRPPYYGQGDAVLRFLKDKYVPLLATGLSILASGVVILLLGLFFFKYDTDKTQPLVGIMLLITGIWLTNRSKMPIWGMGSSSTFLVCFLVLLLVPIAIIIYALERFGEKNRNVTKAIMAFDFIYVIDILFALILGYTIVQLVLSAYIMMAVNILYVEYMLWGTAFGKEKDNVSTRHRLRDRIEFITIAMMLICFVVETLAYLDELMTEVNMINRTGFNIFAAGHVLNLLIANYYNAKDKEDAISRLHESQLELMMGQIQPHFIFNTLSSIRTLVKIDPDTAYNMIYDFSNYLRANVDNVTNLEGILFASEVEHIKSYVNIEKVRFGDRLKVEFDINVTDFIVPPLSIQPLVENAIKHGVTKNVGGGTVWLRSYEEEDYNIVEVEDNGIGFSPERLEEIQKSLTDFSFDYEGDSDSLTEINLTGNGSENHKSSGMKNINMRLKEISNATMTISSTEGQGTIIKVFFPKELSN